MRPLPNFLLGCIAACGVTAAAGNHMGGADRQLDRQSSFVRELRDRPFPADPKDVRVLAWVMDFAHDPEAGAALGRQVERAALLEVLGEPAAPPPATVERAIQEMVGEAKSLQALRQRVLEKPVAAEVIQGHDPTLDPKIHGWSLRHDGGSVWTRDDGGQHRVIGVKVINHGTREVLGGHFTLELGTYSKPLRFECRYNNPIGAGASQPMFCYGDRFSPVEDVLRAIRTAAPGGTAPLKHYEVSYALRGLRFEVRGNEARFVGDEEQVRGAALALIQSKSCGARAACGAAVEELAGVPVLLGIALGLAASAIVLLVLRVAGRRAAMTAGTGIAVVLGVALLGFVVFVGLIGAREHFVYLVLLGGVAAKRAGEVGAGFAIGVVAFTLVLRSIRYLAKK